MDNPPILLNISCGVSGETALKNCYVYYLYDKNGVVRYVGRGTKERISKRSGRSEDFLNILDDYGKLEIIKEGLTRLESISEENRHIEIHSSTILNKLMSGSYNILQPQELSEIFELDNKSPSGIVWKIDRLNCSNTLKAKKGSPAGNIDSSGYWTVPFKGKYLKVHRIVMCLFHNTVLDDPNVLINHIDGNRSNNSIENLEFSNYRHNSINTTVYPKNTSGTVGVSLYVSRGKPVWKARISSESGKRLSKDFSTDKYGYEEAYRLACEWRKQMEELYYNKPQ